MRIGINGMGRIGRLALRAAMGAAERPSDDPRAGNRLEVVQGRWRADITATGDNAIRIADRPVTFSSHAAAAEIPWGDLGIDLVLECTGKFLTLETLQGHLDRGAKRVIVAAPVKVGDVLNIVVGINHDLYDPARHRIVTAASCTTNCLAPVVKVVHEGIGIRHGQITTIHDPTNTNLMVDAPHKDLRRARSAMLSLAPTTTGSATAILKRETTAEEVNRLFAQAAKGPLAGILGYEERPLVSADYARDTRSSIVDALSTMVTDGTMLKVYAWYDNEMGYACRMVDLACHMQSQGI